jgi:hypothetical protein
MVDGERQIPRAVSTSAMDELEIPTTTKADQRGAQFVRLRDRVEERADSKSSCNGVRRHSARYHFA